ncbi:ABC transporter, ATP-binding/permease protein [Caenispirillum salinarum AK4]|uniref:ABC transporter, ATP-binding/permease protein n=1 Tax=Caenispirillum salinarum AK4 TaxID=1238182 RepID=K9GSF9_9PROT|nr:ABC transporter ATP-binding protein [Caenispirillum salinarum]EKV27644.1 ABC transporter, ATP-binding/permease protein [Caenispirillum salinarum AK4]
MTTLRARLAGLFARTLFGPAAGGWLAPVVRHYLPALGMVLAVSLSAAALGLAPPYLTKLLIDEGLVAKDAEALFTWAAAIFAIGLAALLMGAANSLLHLRFSARMLADVRAKALDATLRLPPDRHAGMRVGEIMTRLDGDAGEVQQFAFDALLSGLGAVFRLVGGAVMLMVLDWRLALVAIALTPVELAFLAWARPRTERMAQTVRERRGGLSSFLAESVAGLGVLKTLGAERTRSGALRPLQDSQIDALIRQRQWQEVTGGVPTFLGAIGRTAVLIVGGLWVIRDGWPIGSLIAFLAYMGFLVGPMRTLLGLYHAQARVKVAVRRLMELVGDDRAETDAGEALPPGPGALALEHVTFTHSGAEAPVLQGRSLTIPAGAKALLNGPSGSGKTTLLGLLTRAHDPHAGRVLLDGADVAALDPVALRRAVVVVPQVGWLFSGTVADNLRLAAPEASDADLWRVLEIAQLADWLKAEREGLETVVGERALGFSGGQRQRLAIARALLVPFRVMVLDESLSEVDPATAAKIVAAIDAAFPDRTRILVAHAGAETLGPFDQVVSPRADLRTARGEAPAQRVKARENAV